MTLWTKIILLISVLFSGGCTNAIPEISYLSLPPQPVKAPYHPSAVLVGTHVAEGSSSGVQVRARIKDVQQVESQNSRYKIKAKMAL